MNKSCLDCAYAFTTGDDHEAGLVDTVEECTHGEFPLELYDYFDNHPDGFAECVANICINYVYKYEQEDF